MLLGRAFRAAQDDRYERELVMSTGSAGARLRLADMRLWGPGWPARTGASDAGAASAGGTIIGSSPGAVRAGAVWVRAAAEEAMSRTARSKTLLVI